MLCPGPKGGLMRVRRGTRGEAGRTRPRVVLKFEDEIRLPQGGMLADQLERLGIAPWSRLVNTFPGVEVAPLVRPLSAQLIHELQRKGAACDRRYRPARLASFFAVEAPDGTPLDKLVSFLRIWGNVERAYVQGEAVPMPPTPRADPSADHGYRRPAPEGVDIRYAWRFPGGEGKDVPVVRVGAGGHVAEQVLAALPGCAFGDVLLLDVQYAFGPHGSLMPAEVYDAEFEAIRLAVALGVVVVEAAGEGGYDLDWYQNGAEQRVLAPGGEGFRDSGAILVAGATSAVPHERTAGSNYGGRVDCHACAEFGAAAIVAEVAAATQGMAAASRGYRFAPDQLREVLRAQGTRSADPAADRIGLMPDLRRIIDGDALRLAPDLYLRDFIGDGGEPHTGPISASPDIIVRRDRVRDPQAEFGEGGGTEDTAVLAEVPEPGADAYVYVRVRNQGGDEATGAKATVYWAPAATLLVPKLWHEIGTVVLPPVPTGDALTVSREIVWPGAEIPEDPRCCFVAVLHAHGDPAPGRDALTDWDRFSTLIRDSNNMAARNVQVVDNVPVPGVQPAGYIPLPCLVTGAFDRTREMTLEVTARLTQDTRLLFEAPLALIDELGLRREQVEVDETTSTARLPVTAHGRQPLGTARLPTGSVRACRLLVRLADAPADRFLRVALRQSYQGIEVGRVTWLLAPPSWYPSRPRG